MDAVQTVERAPSGPWRGLATRITRRELVLWCLAFVGTAHLLDNIVFLPGGGMLSELSGILLIAWGCAVAVAWRDTDRALPTPGEVAGAAGLALVTLFAHGAALMVPMTALGLWLVLRRGGSADARRVGAILLAIAAQRLWSRFIMMIFAGPILRADTALAGGLLKLFMPGAEFSGNRIVPADGGPGITVLMACSSFANLSLMFLCFASLAMLDRANDARRAIWSLLGIGALLIFLNTGRLLMMARSVEQYEFWHNGMGAQIFAVTTTLLTVVLCSMGARWAARDRSSSAAG